jgi:serine/threonine protein kinase
MNEPPPDLDDVVLAYLKSLDAGEEPDMNAWLARYPQFAADLAAFFRCERQLAFVGSISTPIAMDDTPSRDAVEPRPDVAVVAGRFELGPELGRGGIGTVRRARDPLLDRPLAVKLLQQRHRRQSHVAHRFLDEARIAAGLQHPGVPPIHDIGEASDGRPFIAMKLIEGRTLAELLRARLRLTDDLPRFLMVFEQVAQTMAYAHSRGIIHRDLKPQNVMSGSFGEVQVMDWGLAKKSHAIVDDASCEDATNPTVAADGEALEATRPGAVIGTPAYMSPEQARGESDRLDARTDVFGLGAILYEILTGQSPFPDRRQTERAKQGDMSDAFARLDDANCDPELAALAKRCMAPDPARRPKDAQGVAECMTAYHAGVQERLRQVELEAAKTHEARKRRRIVVILATLTLFSATAGLGVALWLQARANANLSAKNQQLADANDRERQRFELAMEAIGLFHGDISQDLILREKQFDKLRGKLLRGATDFYEKLEAQLQDQSDPQSRAALGRSYHDLAGLEAAIGNLDEAKVVHGRAVAVRREIAAKPGATAEAKLDVASSLLALGWLQHRTSDPKVVDSVSEAESIVRRLEADAGTSDDSQKTLSQICVLRADLALQAGRVAAGQQEFERAKVILQRFLDAHPSDIRLHEMLGGILVQLGVAASGLADTQRNYREAMAHYQVCADSEPSNPWHAFNVAHCHAALAGLFDNAEASIPEAIRDAELARTTLSNLIADYPSVTDYHRVFALATSYAGKLYWISDRPADAREAFETTLATYQRISEASPHTMILRAKVATAMASIATLDDEAGDFDAARDGFEKAKAIQEELLTSTQSDWERVMLAKTNRRLGLVYRATGRITECAEHTRMARNHMQPILESMSAYPQLRMELGACHATLAGLAGLEGSGVPLGDAETESAMALEMLRSAEAIGFQPSPLILMRDPGWDALRDSDEFKELIQRLRNVSSRD